MPIDFELAKIKRTQEEEHQLWRSEQIEIEAARMKKSIVEFLSKKSIFGDNYGKAFTHYELSKKFTFRSNKYIEREDIQGKAFDNVMAYFIGNPNNAEKVKTFTYRSDVYFCIGCTDAQIKSLNEM